MDLTMTVMMIEIQRVPSRQNFFRKDCEDGQIPGTHGTFKEEPNPRLEA